MGWNYLSIPKLHWCNCWSLELDQQFHATLSHACDYLSMLRLWLNHISKRGPWSQEHHWQPLSSCISERYGYFVLNKKSMAVFVCIFFINWCESLNSQPCLTPWCSCLYHIMTFLFMWFFWLLDYLCPKDWNIFSVVHLVFTYFPMPCKPVVNLISCCSIWNTNWFNLKAL